MKILAIGATGSIGENLCRELSRKGYEMHGVGRNEAILKSLEERGFVKDYITADITEEEGRDKVIEYSAKNSAECLVYSQGLIDHKPLEEVSMDEIKRILDVNLHSVILMDWKFLRKHHLFKKLFV